MVCAGAAVGVCCLWAGGCVGSNRIPSPASAPAAGDYVVQPGDTLYGIAWRHDLDYRDLARWNRIGSDYALVVGQVLKLHATPEPAAPVAAAPRPAAPVPTAPLAAAPSAAEPHGAARPRAPAAAVVAGTRWVWPTDGSAPPRSVPGGGILLFGRLGQDVRAASSGRVVYVGGGLRGYGNLVILKHADSLLSSYAHNRELLVREGEEVSTGQVIARMGTGPHRIAALYFEIRINGKPRDPLKYLPAR